MFFAADRKNGCQANLNAATTSEIAILIQDKITVSESGIEDSKDMHKVSDNVNAVLIGTSLVKSKDIGKKIDSLFKPKVKICGITNLKDAKKAVGLGADYLGFIFYKKSSRYLKPAVAKKIISKIENKNVKFVGVFVNEKLSSVKKLSKNLDFIQLHGGESNEYIKRLGGNVIKAFRVKDNKDIKRINSSAAEYVLLDSYDKTLYGGTGKTFDWRMIDKIKNKRVFLSGGLNPGNVKKALKLNTYAIDTASGVEKCYGKKDHKKLKKFIQDAKK